MNCPKCKAELPDKAKFCLECGSNISAISGESAQERPDLSLGQMKTMVGGKERPAPGPSDKPDLSVGDIRTMQGPSPGGGRNRAPSGPDVSLGDERTLQRPGSPAVSASQQSRGTQGASLAERYTIQEEIGRGGFAMVWKARDKKLDRIVAVKRLLPEKLEGPMGRQTLDRFEREATAIAQLNHRNIVAVYDHDTDAEGHYIVMEYVAGGTLRDYLKSKGGKLSVPEAVALVKGIAQGLGNAHRKNLVHRDIKPANILLLHEGDELIPKILDFGLARFGSESELSMSGYGMGTPWYMPPEQRRNAKGVNHTADIYALGKVLYELVSGETPDNVDPDKIPEPWLTSVILKCIKSNPEERYFSCEDVVKDLIVPGEGSGSVVPATTGTAVNTCPSCGTANPEEVKFCRQCGTGLTRLCPECEHEDLLNVRFCGKCGTDIDSFIGLRDMAARMEQYLGAKKPSRVLKEADLAKGLALKPKGDKGRALLQQVTKLADQARRVEQQKMEVHQFVTTFWHDGHKADEVESAIAEYGDLADDLPAEMVESRGRLPVRRKLAEISDALDAVDRLLAANQWREAEDAAGKIAIEALPVHVDDQAEYEVLAQRYRKTPERVEALRQQEISAKRAAMQKATYDDDWDAVKAIASDLLVLCSGDESAQRALQRAGVENERISKVGSAWDAFCAHEYDQCARLCREAIKLVGSDFRIDADGFSGLCSELESLALRCKQALLDAQRRRQWLKIFGVAALVLAGLMVWAGLAIRTAARKRSFDAAWRKGHWSVAVGVAQELGEKHPRTRKFLDAWSRRQEVARIDHPSIVKALEESDSLLMRGHVEDALWVLSNVEAQLRQYHEARDTWRKAEAGVVGPISGVLSEHGGKQWIEIQRQVQLAAESVDPVEGASFYKAACSGLADAVTEAHQIARASRIETALAAARQATQRGSWAAVVADADKVLEMDANHQEAQALKDEAEGNQVPTWKLVATVGGREVPATIIIGDQTYTAPRTLNLREGTLYSAEFSYESGGRKYTGGPVSVTLDWKGEREQRVVLQEQRVPVVGRNDRIDDLGLDLVWVESGSFQMGTPTGGDSDERPVRTVGITRGYWMGKTEVTQGQWRSIMGDNPSHFKGDDLPVESVSWDRCVEFCRKLTERERRAGRLPDGYVYRLPTEAEWEYAARGGVRGRNTTYAGSDDLNAVAWHDGNSQNRTQRVGTRAANELGLHDMSGNVWEWVQDWYQDSYSGLATTDPTGPANGSLHVVRGGSWNYTAADCRVAARSWVRPSNTYSNLGFRVVLAPVP